MQGAITDASGGALAGVRVEVRVPATGLQRVTVSDERGFYRVAAIDWGVMEMKVERESFRAVVFTPTLLAAGETLQRDVRMDVAGRNDTVQVSEDAPAPRRDSAEAGDVIRGPQVRELPLNGRNWQGLLPLVPGALNTGTGDARGVRFYGRGVDDNNFKFDGVDATGVRNQVPRDDVRLAISLEAVAEFRVRAGMYTAETGGTMSAQVEVVSRSGSNDMHGGLFEYLRNDKLNSRSPFDPSSVPPFRLNQFGGSLGGALHKDRLFYFASYEGLAQRLGQSFVATVPSESYRARALAQTPALRPFLDAYPHSSTSTASVDIAQWTGPGSQKNDQHSGTIRLDDRFSDKTQMFARFSTNRMAVVAPLGDSTGYMNAYNRVDETVTTGVLDFQMTPTPHLVTELRAGVNRVPYRSKYDSPILPALRVAGLTSIPGGRESLVNSMTYTYAGSVTWTRGIHTVKAGMEVRPLRFALRTIADGSAIVFTDMNTFAAGQANTANINGFLPTRGVSKTQWFGYAQDELRPWRDVTVNLGLRYESFGVLTEDHGRAQAFDIETCGGFCPAGTSFTQPDHDNVAPRLSVAWAPSRWNGRTVFRAGGGLFYGEGQLGNQTSPVENETVRISLTGSQLQSVPLGDLLLPTLASGTGTLTVSPLDLQRRRQDMYTAQWSLQYAQQLAAGFALENAYVASKGTQLFARTYVNLIQPSGVRPLPQYGLIPVRSNGANSTFEGLTTSLRRRAGAASFAASYQWSHAIDEYSAGGDDSGYPENVACRACDRASSDFDVRQAFQMNGVWDLPLLRGRRWMSALLGGWKLSGMWTARSGRAITVTMSRPTSDMLDGNATSPQRPNGVAGVPVQTAANGTVGWLNLAAFSAPAKGQWGNAGRNLARGPVITNVDAALTRRIALREKVWIDVRAEVFNVMNHPQFANPQSNFSSPATFGRISQLVNTGATGSGTPRQAEFAVRLGF